MASGTDWRRYPAPDPSSKMHPGPAGMRLHSLRTAAATAPRSVGELVPLHARPRRRRKTNSITVAAPTSNTAATATWTPLHRELRGEEEVLVSLCRYLIRSAGLHISIVLQKHGTVNSIVAARSLDGAHISYLSVLYISNEKSENTPF
jgi:hypothetical protein